ncbi:MAG: radical SAM protein [Candidatus Gastranaerophilales bacterium]|nr:radical SAM protein [Candidatus Gastranaerophilales bacterium]
MVKMDIKKILLVNLPEDGEVADFYTPKYVLSSFHAYPPLGVLYIATAIKDEYPVKIIDTHALNYSIEQTVDAIVNESPELLGISCPTLRLYTMLEIIKRVKVKLPNLVIVVGGPHVSIYPVETINLPGVDYAIAGQGEITFLKLIDILSGKVSSNLKDLTGLIFKEEGRVIQNSVNYDISLDNIKMPDRSLLNYDLYYTAADSTEQIVTMISSRGCPFQCIFCDVQDKKYRWRSAKNVVDEMEHIANTFDNPLINIFDDTFNLLKDRVLEICEEIQKRNLKVKWTTRARVHPLDEEMIAAMKAAGLKRIHFGVESGSDNTLKKIKKGVKREQIEKAFELCKKYKIDTLAYFVIGFDWETKKDINETISFIKKIKPDYIAPSILYPLAKTEVYDEMVKNGKIDSDYWYKFAVNPTKDFSLPLFRTEKTQKYLSRKIDEIYLTFYLSPGFVLKNLKSKGKNEFGFLFKIKLGFLIIKSYFLNLFAEITCFGEGNDIK